MHYKTDKTQKYYNKYLYLPQMNSGLLKIADAEVGKGLRVEMTQESYMTNLTLHQRKVWNSGWNGT